MQRPCPAWKRRSSSPSVFSHKNSKSRTIWIQTDCHPNDHNITMIYHLKTPLRGRNWKHCISTEISAALGLRVDLLQFHDVPVYCTIYLLAKSSHPCDCKAFKVLLSMVRMQRQSKPTAQVHAAEVQCEKLWRCALKNLHVLSKAHIDAYAIHRLEPRHIHLRWLFNPGPRC